MAQQFRHLLSPIKIGSMTVRNRVYSSPHGSGFYDILTGLPTERENKYRATKAKGGVGLVGTMLHPVHPGANLFRLPGARDAFKKAADAVHQYGGKIAVQIGNVGGIAAGFITTGVLGLGYRQQASAPSALPMPGIIGQRNVPHEMTKDEIKEAVSEFAYAAVVAKEAGVDAVEIHGGHGYLITQFMSPYTNKRTDEYGGTLEKRMRFPLEIMGAVRDAVGDEYVVGMRFSGDEFIEGGYTLDDALIMAPMLTETGKLDFFNVTAGIYPSMATLVESMYYPLNSFVYLAAAIKEVVDIPVIARGRITDPVQAEQILASNQADMVSMVRAIIADPEFVNKASEGRVDEIRRCIGCNQCWWARRVFGPITCTMNPAVGFEGVTGWGELEPAAVKKRVMVIGGGPAGLETARVAALRGHQVSLYEKGAELGGQTLIAAKAPGRDGFLDLGRYYTYQMKLLKVDVHLNTEVTDEIVKAQAPDAVVVATGSVPIIPDIPGADGGKVVEVRQVLNGEVEVGNNVVIIDAEDQIQALSTADFLSERGKKVEILCAGELCGAKLELPTREAVYQRLFRKGVVISTLTEVKEISGNTVIARNFLTQQERRIEGVDTVVIAYGGRENNALYYALKGQVKESRKVGDADGIRMVNYATMAGAEVGRAL